MILTRRRTLQAPINADPFIVPEGFGTSFLTEYSLANVVDEYDSFPSIQKKYSYAVQSEDDAIGEIEEYTYIDNTIEVNPYPVFTVKQQYRHYLPNLSAAQFAVFETLSGVKQQLQVYTEDKINTYVDEFGQEHSFKSYGYGRKYVDFTPHSTNRFVVVSGISNTAIIPMDCIWFFIAHCDNIITENYLLYGQISKSFYVLEEYNTTKYIHLREGLKYLNNRAFYGCKNLEGDLTIPEAVTSIGDECFMRTTLNGRLTINGVKTLGKRALQQIQESSYGVGWELGNKYTSLSINASFNPLETRFDYTLSWAVSSIEIIEASDNKYFLHNGNLYYEGDDAEGNHQIICVCCPRGNTNLDRYRLKEGTTHIQLAFYNLPSSYEKNDIYIPDTIQYIERKAFYATVLTGYLDFYNSDLRFLGSYAFHSGTLNSHEEEDKHQVIRLGKYTKLDTSYFGLYNIARFEVHPDNTDIIVTDPDNPEYDNLFLAQVYPFNTSYGLSFYKLAPLYDGESFIVPEGIQTILSNNAINHPSLKSLILPESLRYFEGFNSLNNEDFNEIHFGKNFLNISYVSIPYLKKIYIEEGARSYTDLDNRYQVGSANSFSLVTRNHCIYLIEGIIRNYFSDYVYSFQSNIPQLVSFPSTTILMDSFLPTSHINELHVRCVNPPPIEQYRNPTLMFRLPASETRSLHVPIDALGNDLSEKGYNRGNSCWKQQGIFDGGGIHYDLVRVYGNIIHTGEIPDRFVIKEIGNTIEYEGETVNMYEFTAPVTLDENGIASYECWVKVGKAYTLTFTFEDDSTRVHDINITEANKPSLGHDLFANIVWAVPSELEIEKELIFIFNTESVDNDVYSNTDWNVT